MSNLSQHKYKSTEFYQGRDSLNLTWKHEWKNLWMTEQKQAEKNSIKSNKMNPSKQNGIENYMYYHRNKVNPCMKDKNLKQWHNQNMRIKFEKWYQTST